MGLGGWQSKQNGPLVSFSKATAQAIRLMSSMASGLYVGMTLWALALSNAFLKRPQRPLLRATPVASRVRA